MSNELVKYLYTKLPGIIKSVADEYRIKQYQADQDFLEDRIGAWHQFGLLTHSQKATESYDGEAKSFLKEWNLIEYVQGTISGKVDKFDKKSLFLAALLLHDLGKICCYGNDTSNRNHEELSLQVIERGIVKKILSGFNLGKKDFEYLVDVVRVHDVIGKNLRDRLKHEGRLTFEYLESDDVRKLCYETAKKEKMRLEQGVFFLCDSLAKTDLRIEAKTDEELAKSENQVDEELKLRGLPEKLRNGVLQLPLTVKLARIYLETLARSDLSSVRLTKAGPLTE